MEKSRVISRKQQIAAIATSVGLSVMLTVGAVFGATTISTDITTGGSLTVTGAATLSSTLSVTGLTTMVYASSTSQSLAYAGTLMIGGMATVTGSTGNIATQGTLTATGLTSLVYASTTGVSLTQASALTVGGMATVTGLTGNINTEGNVTVVGTASTTNLLVGGGSTISGIVTGFCNIPNSGIPASTTVGVLCSSATGILTSYRVFVSATGSLPVNFVVTQASSTAADTIGLLIANLGYPTAVTQTGNVSFNFFGVK
ncbi:MAG: hypothetical protein Q7R85_01750 [bacterium]|nr:hypothetical protein [bacterium]